MVPGWKVLSGERGRSGCLVGASGFLQHKIVFFVVV